jgi:glycosyltransferase involved in cell wall biosynthesis
MKGTFGLPDMPVDVIVGQRMVLPEMLPVWRSLKRFGPLVHELDDDLFHIDQRNIQAATLYRRESVRDTLRHTSQIADMLTVSTEPLKKIMAEEADIDPDKIVVVPNMIDGGMFDIDRPRRDRLTIGWAGGGSHDRDMEQLHKPLRKILDRNPAVDFHNIGHDFRKLVRRENMRYTPWAVDIPTYWRTIDFDIGVVPLAHTIFNQSKSGLKILELSALGIPVIAMDSPPYRDVVVDGETGFLVDSAWQWVKRMQQLIDDDELREQMGKAGREYVRRHWSIADGWKLWEEAYRRVVRIR